LRAVPQQCTQAKQPERKRAQRRKTVLGKENHTMEDVIHHTNECKLDIDVAKLARTLRSSSASFRALVREYRRHGVTEREIVAAMAASPLLIDAIGRGR
jgi:Xaa-Pro aminopeptidase